MTAKGVREVTVKAYQCVLCQTVYRTEGEAASCYHLCVDADQDPISKRLAYQRRQAQEAVLEVKGVQSEEEPGVKIILAHVPGHPFH